jgi:hypothetical protein
LAWANIGIERLAADYVFEAIRRPSIDLPRSTSGVASRRVTACRQAMARDLGCWALEMKTPGHREGLLALEVD